MLSSSSGRASYCAVRDTQGHRGQAEQAGSGELDGRGGLHGSGKSRTSQRIMFADINEWPGIYKQTNECIRLVEKSLMLRRWCGIVLDGMQAVGRL